MARPATSKNIFALTKYSRAAIRQPGNSQGIQGSKGDYDWHHHTQPNLRLLLELRKSAQGIPESVRLRVVWIVDKSQAPPSNKPLQQENVIFEDIDLLVIRKHVHPFPTQGLPLKAVFRDNMVGIRYLPPQAKSNVPSEYRRFQITFQLPSDSAALIEAIRDVCPCKPSPVNNPAVVLESAMSAPLRPGGADIIHNSQTQVPFSAHLQSQILQTPSGSRLNSVMTQYPDDRMPPSSQMNISSDPPIESSMPFHQSRQAGSAPIVDPRMQAYPSTALTHHQSLAYGPSRSDPSSSPFYPQAQQRSEVHSRRPSMAIYDSTMHELEKTQSDPNVSRSVPMPTPPVSSQTLDASSIFSANTSSRKEPAESATTDANTSTTTAATTKDPLLKSLYEACRLDQLPRDELEQLVAHIVREDGFTELLEKVDSLWPLKAVVNM